MIPSSDSLEDALEVLAKKAAYNAEYRRTRKVAFEIPAAIKNLGGSALETLKSSPTLTTGLLGAGLGGAYGMATDFGRPEEERRPFSSALTGAMGGAALGAGAGLAGHQIHKYLQNRPQAPVADPTTFEHGGRKYTLKNPSEAAGLLPELQQLEGRSPVTRGVGAVSDAIGSYVTDHPILSTIGAADIGSHTLGSLAEMGDAGRGGGATQSHFERGLQRLKDEGSSFTKEQINHMKQWAAEHNPETFRRDYLDSTRNNLGITRPVGPKHTGPKPMITPHELKTVGSLGTGSVRPGGLRSLLDLLPERLRPGNNLTGTGYGGEGRAVTSGIHKALKKLKINNGVTRGGAAAVGRGVEGTLRGLGNMPRPTSLIGRLGPRAALYAGIPALQWYTGQSGAEGAARARIQELIQQHATPVGE